MASPDDSSPAPPTVEAPGEESADRRTDLAVERTQLAWWRTGLTALAVAIGVGRVVPELSESDATTWPYAAVGIAFAIYGIALFWQGTQGRVAPGPGGASGRMDSRTNLALALAGAGLGLLVVVLIAAA